MNYFCYIPENEIEVYVLIWNKSVYFYSLVNNILSGIYTLQFLIYGSFLFLASVAFYCCTLFLSGVGVALASKSVHKTCSTRSTNIGTSWLFICCPVLNKCLYLYKSILLASSVRRLYCCLTSLFQYSSIIIHPWDIWNVYLVLFLSRHINISASFSFLVQQACPSTLE